MKFKREDITEKRDYTGIDFLALYFKIAIIYVSGIVIHEFGHVFSMLLLGGTPHISFLSIGGTVSNPNGYEICIISGFVANVLFGIIISTVGIRKRAYSIYFGGSVCIYHEFTYFLFFSPLLNEGDAYAFALAQRSFNLILFDLFLIILFLIQIITQIVCLIKIKGWKL